MALLPTQFRSQDVWGEDGVGRRPARRSASMLSNLLLSIP